MGSQPSLALCHGSAVSASRAHHVALGAAMLVTWVRYPRHILTWTTLPFFIFHSLVGHKELRYLFPIVLPAALAFILAYAPAPGEVARPAWLRAIWGRRNSRLAKLIYGLNLLFLAVNCVTNKQPKSGDPAIHS